MKILVGLLATGLGLVCGFGSGFGCGVSWAQGTSAASTAAAAAGKRPMTFADLMAMKRVSDPQISASGKWVMFSVTEVSLEKNTKVNHLWVVALGGDGAKAGSSASPGNGNDRQKDAAEVQVTSGGGETNGRFSPDGRFVSYTSAEGQIVVAPWDEAAGRPGVGRALTAVSTGADGGVWSPDSKRLLFVSSVYPECSDKASWSEEDACDKAKDEAAAKSPVKAQIWDHLLYRHWNAYTGEKRSHVLVVSAGDGSAVRDLTLRSVVGDAETPTFSLGGPVGYAWAPDAKEIAYVTNLDTVKAASTNNDVFTLRIDEAGAKAVKVSTSPGSDDGPAYSPDGKWLAFRSQARGGFESDLFRLMFFDREKKATKEVSSTWVPGFDLWIDEFTWQSPSLILFASADKGEGPIRAVQTGGELEQRVLSKDGEFSDIQTHDDVVVANRMAINHPTEIVMFVGGKMTQLTHVNDGVLNQLDLAGMESYWFAGAEGAKVQGFVVRPPNFDAGKKYPVKFLMHGGPQTAFGDAWSYRWNAQLMAASGYVVVMVNRRGSTGYGQKFVDEVSGDWGGKAYIDLMKGLDAAEARFPFIDKTRECALGASYGGFMANWVLTHTDRFKCIVTHDGMFNPQSAYGTTEEMWFNEWEFRPMSSSAKDGKGPAGMVEEARPGQPWDYFDKPAAEDPFRKWSPMLSIKNAKTPTLVIHSQRDYRLDVSEGLQLFTALQRLGVPSRMLYFPDEGHWVLKPQNSQLWYETVGDWCDKWTKSGRYAEK